MFSNQNTKFQNWIIEKIIFYENRFKQCILNENHCSVHSAFKYFRKMFKIA